jgi:Zn-dependent protease with chaperone function
MRNALTKLILALGRYAVLPAVAVALAVFAAWLAAIDHYPRLAWAASFIVLPVTTGAVFLTYGLLLLPRKRKAAPGVEERAAPGLWAIWKELDRSSDALKRTLVIDADVNASIGEQRQFMGVFGRQVTMTIGLPLLIVLDEQAVRAVIAHEVAHAALRHTSGSGNLSEFMTAAANIFEYADPERTITGRIAAVLLNALLERIEKEYLILSRQDELAADRQGAERVGSHEMARALVLIVGMTARIGELVFGPLEKECLGAIRVPTPPLQRMISQVHTIRMIDGINAAALKCMTSEKEDLSATHPPLRQRLANLGFAEIPKFDAVQTSAALSLMPDHIFTDLVARFDRQWSKAAAARVDINYR